MPFIGRDWRSPGEAWVKTETFGWQRMKIIESQLHPSCHQSLTCSWPPKSEFGQLMANHCVRSTDNNLSLIYSNHREPRGSLSSDASSSNSSRGGSLSPTPTGSPEKNIHHVHPITISSPYGQYSCCSHLLKSNSSPKSRYLEPTVGDRQQDTRLSRSLSRESLASSNDKLRQRIPYNNSVPDFHPQSNLISERNVNEKISQDLNKTSCIGIMLNNDIKEKSSQNLTNPMLMKNGYKLNDTDLVGHEISCSFDKDASEQLSGISQQITCCCANMQGTQNRPSEPRTAPHCRISVRTREVAMYNTISEAFYRLDFCNAIHDIRRFNYICKLLHLLITQSLTSLSGCATKVLFTMLEQVAWEVSSNKRNIHVIKNLLAELKQMIQKYYCWGRPIGSSLLWQQHFDTIERINQIVDEIELSNPNNDQAKTTFNNLPVEMIREILLRLNDYRDLVNSAQASPVMRSMIEGQYLWKQLCRYHFTEEQLKLALDSRNCGMFARKSAVNGLKYSRTTSADGKTSFRNPVNRRSTSKQQNNQVNSRLNSRANEVKVEKKSSYVTKAIKIFDKAGTSSNSESSRVKKSDLIKRGKQQDNTEPHPTETPRQAASVEGSSRKSSSSNSNQETDWERVFHQLRKILHIEDSQTNTYIFKNLNYDQRKFDLKEEYADCLLLCRHCRCLFWKSFGHPCIKGDESPTESRFGLEQSWQLENSFRDYNNRGHNVTSHPNQEASQSGSSRVSVAVLSRNFDDRAQGILQDENIAPQAGVLNISRRDNQSRVLNAELEDRLRGRYLRLAERRAGLSTGNSNSNNSNQTNRQNNVVPKHVAISPQAFLNFFSL